MKNLLMVALLTMFTRRIAGQTIRLPFRVFYTPGAVGDERHIQRLGELMRGFVERAAGRYREIMGIKELLDTDTVDERIAFEKGYVMGEIIDTYRKGLVFTEKQMNKGRYLETDRIRYLMYVQNAYIKVYHLVHMMHEINPKFGADNTGQIIKLNLALDMHKHSPTYYGAVGFGYAKQLDEIRQRLVKEREQKVKREKRIRNDEMDRYGSTTIKPTTNWWPLAYGWDIDYYW